jgi:hypothetical protein
MKILNIVAGASLFASTLGCLSQSTVRCGQTLDAPLRRGAELTIASVATEIEVVGTDQEMIHVSCRADDPNTASDIRIQLSGSADHANLTITGDHLTHNNLHLRVEVPRKMDLALQLSAGSVKVDDLVGNKDIELTAGQISISDAHDWNYKDVSASVSIGAVNAQVYGANRGGFFGVFHKTDANGEYRLHAHVMTGQIELLGKNANSVAEE